MVEKQYDFIMDIKQQQFGLMSNQVWNDDPKRLLFLLSRYKFVAKMFSGMDDVLEIGCADGFGSRIVKQEVKNLTAVDIDPVFIKDAKKNTNNKWPVDFHVMDFTKQSLAIPPVHCFTFDGIYCIDVLEHIPPGLQENKFILNILDNLRMNGECLIGIPSLESQTYASKASKEGHVNCKTADQLKSLMKRHFRNVSIFSMNDEVVHTGFYPMAQYLWAKCCTPIL